MKNEIKIDWDRLISGYFGSPAPNDWDTNPQYRVSLVDSKAIAKEALRQALPLILAHVAENASYSLCLVDQDHLTGSAVKQSITSQEEVLIKLLEL